MHCIFRNSFRQAAAQTLSFLWILMDAIKSLFPFSHHWLSLGFSLLLHGGIFLIVSHTFDKDRWFCIVTFRSSYKIPAHNSIVNPSSSCSTPRPMETADTPGNDGSFLLDSASAPSINGAKLMYPFSSFAVASGSWIHFRLCQNKRLLYRQGLIPRFLEEKLFLLLASTIMRQAARVISATDTHQVRKQPPLRQGFFGILRCMISNALFYSHTASFKQSPASWALSCVQSFSRQKSVTKMVSDRYSR